MVDREGETVVSEILERGDIYFVYRPRVGRAQVRGGDDVQRLYLLLQPDGGGRTRRVVVGRKRLPAASEHERFWGFVDAVSDQPAVMAQELAELTYQTGTRGERTSPPARPAGEGRYALVGHGDHTHLAYQLELPDEPGAVQRELDLVAEADYLVAVKNPEVPAPPGAGLAPERRADLPDPLQQRFEGRRFTGAAPDLLDHEGVELVLIAAGEDAAQELGVRIDAESEDAESAEVFRRLRMSRQAPTEPLTEGEWR